MSKRILDGDVAVQGDVQAGGSFGNIASEVQAEKNAALNSWTNHFEVNTAVDRSSWFDVCWSPLLGLFAAVATHGGTTGGYKRVATSPDGENWTRYTTPTGGSYRGICWSPELRIFCAVGTGANEKVITSTNGTTWTPVTVDTSPYPGFQAVCWSPELGIFCAVGYGTIYTSPDGSTWTDQGITAYDWEAICWSPELGIFCAVTGSDIGISSDGVNWSFSTPGFSFGINGIAWSPKKGFCICGNLCYFAVSADGTSWTERKSLEFSNTIRTFQKVVWIPELGVFAACAQDYTNEAVGTSPDGVYWVPHNTYPTNVASIVYPSYGIAWSPSLGRVCVTNNEDYRGSVLLSGKADFAAAIARGLS